MPTTTPPIPQITTALKGPLHDIEKNVLNQQFEIESWFRKQFQSHPCPFYSSVDIRNAGYKVAPVDTNLFPAGFNNLNPDFMPLCIQATQHYLNQHFPHCQSLLLLAETHTSNPHYYDNLGYLADLLQQAGYSTTVGSCHPELTQSKTLTLSNQQPLTLHPLQRDPSQTHKISANGQTPCLIISNNDFSQGLPAILEGIAQPIIPNPQLGWHQREKSQHFTHHTQLCKDFAVATGLNPWWLSAHHAIADDVNFKTGQGIEALTHQVDRVLQKTRDAYRQHGIQDRPFAIIKANQGTYGLGIMSVHDASEVTQLNRKQKQKMANGKGGRQHHQLMVQEGVYTHETWGEAQAVAEPVVYMIDHHVVGGFYRVHANKGSHENLNAPGMHFEPLAFAKACNHPAGHLHADAPPNRFYLYGVVARLALLAAAKELSCLDN